MKNWTNGMRLFRGGPFGRAAPVGAVAGAALVLLGLAGVAGAGQGPWDRTETREPCSSFEPLRQPFFGDSHFHTVLSADAVINGTVNTPSDGYSFAKGGALPYSSGNAVPEAQLRRPLDWAAATDHAEFLGETSICQDPTHPGYASDACVQVRVEIGQQFDGPRDSASFLTYFFPTIAPGTPRFGWCGTEGAECLDRSSIVWQSIQDDAELHYDRSAACSFTNFVGYEWSANTSFKNLHRVVLFRNEHVPSLPTSYFEEPHEIGLWHALEAGCDQAGNGCQSLAVPHNSNISGGSMFSALREDGTSYSAEDAALRGRKERLVEVVQHKGDSECHPSFSNDELCGFEEAGVGSQLPTDEPLEENYVRWGLNKGLQEHRRIGVNPMAFGFIGATDTHMAMAGNTREDEYFGHVGSFDETPEQQVMDMSLFHAGTNPGGLGVLWAEENSRDSLYASMDRREAYSTSGTRPVVRFFAGNLPKDMCSRPDFVRQGYLHGVPMGGDLGRRPTFAVLAQKDPGLAGMPGNDLQRVQIIKGWVDRAGRAHEKVFDIGGDPENEAGVDTASCQPTGAGFETICATWRDPKFDKNQQAFYYARVVENPSCRWSQYLCNRQGVDCSGTVPPAFALCCDASLPKAIQERAVTSPIFYSTENFSTVRAMIVTAKKANGDKEVRISAKIPRAPLDLDPSKNDLTIELRDDDVFFSATIPAGTLSRRGTTFELKDSSGSLAGIRSLRIKKKGNRAASLQLKTVPLALPNLDAGEHMVHLKLSAGNAVLEHRRLWVESKGGKVLGTGSG